MSSPTHRPVFSPSPISSLHIQMMGRASPPPRSNPGSTNRGGILDPMDLKDFPLGSESKSESEEELQNFDENLGLGTVMDSDDCMYYYHFKYSFSYFYFILFLIETLLNPFLNLINFILFFFFVVHKFNVLYSYSIFCFLLY